jgi:hypothetical protein
VEVALGCRHVRVSGLRHNRDRARACGGVVCDRRVPQVVEGAGPTSSTSAPACVALCGAAPRSQPGRRRCPSLERTEALPPAWPIALGSTSPPCIAHRPSCVTARARHGSPRLFVALQVRLRGVSHIPTGMVEKASDGRTSA